MPQAAEALNSKNLTKSACCPIIPGIWPLDADLNSSWKRNQNTENNFVYRTYIGVYTREAYVNRKLSRGRRKEEI